MFKSIKLYCTTRDPQTHHRYQTVCIAIPTSEKQSLKTIHALARRRSCIILAEVSRKRGIVDFLLSIAEESREKNADIGSAIYDKYRYSITGQLSSTNDSDLK